MKRPIKVLSSIALASLLIATTVPAANISASGIRAGSYTLNSSNFKMVADFDGVLGAYTPGMKPGSVTDRVGTSKNKKAIMAQGGIGITYSLEIVSGKGQSGNAIEQTVLDPSDGVWEPWHLEIQNAKGAAKVDNVEGATDFMFWCDTTGFLDAKTKKPIQKSFMLIFQEGDVLANGKLNTGKASAWEVKPAENGGKIYYEKNGTWESMPTCKKADNYCYWMNLPISYKGWIRVPFTSLTHDPAWTSQVDSDGKFNGKQLQYISFDQGDWPSQKEAKIVYDSFGFYGSFKTTPAPSSSKASNSVSNSNKPGNGNTTSGAASNASAASTASGSSSAAASSGASSTESTSSDSTSGASTASADTSSAAANTQAQSSNHTWLIVLIVVLVLAAAGVGGFFIFKKVKKA